MSPSIAFRALAKIHFNFTNQQACFTKGGCKNTQLNSLCFGTSFETEQETTPVKTKPITPAVHGIIDYALVSSLLALPSLFGFSKKVRKLYAAEALALLTYVALTDQPAAVKPLIPFTTHGKIDPFNVGQFALQIFWKRFRKDKNARAFNIVFTVIAGVTVALTDWYGQTKNE